MTDSPTKAPTDAEDETVPESGDSVSSDDSWNSAKIEDERRESLGLHKNQSVSVKIDFGIVKLLLYFLRKN